MALKLLIVQYKPSAGKYQYLDTTELKSQINVRENLPFLHKW